MHDRTIYVEHKTQICTIVRLCCTKHGFVLYATIRGLCSAKSTKYEFAQSSRVKTVESHGEVMELYPELEVSIALLSHSSGIQATISALRVWMCNHLAPILLLRKVVLNAGFNRLFLNMHNVLIALCLTAVYLWR